MTDLDDVDRAILRELDDDARMPVAVLAQRLGLARGTVHARLAKFDRLVEIKTAHDPDNLFRSNRNIQPRR